MNAAATLKDNEMRGAPALQLRLDLAADPFFATADADIAFHAVCRTYPGMARAAGSSGDPHANDFVIGAAQGWLEGRAKAQARLAEFADAVQGARIINSTAFFKAALALMGSTTMSGREVANTLLALQSVGGAIDPARVGNIFGAPDGRH